MLKSNGTHRKITLWDVYNCICSSIVLIQAMEVDAVTSLSVCGNYRIKKIDCQLYLNLVEMGNVGPLFSPSE